MSSAQPNMSGASMLLKQQQRTRPNQDQFQELFPNSKGSLAAPPEPRQLSPPSFRPGGVNHYSQQPMPSDALTRAPSGAPPQQRISPRQQSPSKVPPQQGRQQQRSPGNSRSASPLGGGAAGAGNVLWHGTVEKVGANLTAHKRIMFVTAEAVIVCLPAGGVTRTIKEPLIAKAVLIPPNVVKMEVTGEPDLVVCVEHLAARDAIAVALQKATRGRVGIGHAAGLQQGKQQSQQQQPPTQQQAQSQQRSPSRAPSATAQAVAAAADHQAALAAPQPSPGGPFRQPQFSPPPQPASQPPPLPLASSAEQRAVPSAASPLNLPPSPYGVAEAPQPSPPRQQQSPPPPQQQPTYPPQVAPARADEVSQIIPPTSRVGAFASMIPTVPGEASRTPSFPEHSPQLAHAPPAPAVPPAQQQPVGSMPTALSLNPFSAESFAQQSSPQQQQRLTESQPTAATAAPVVQQPPPVVMENLSSNREVSPVGQRPGKQQQPSITERLTAAAPPSATVGAPAGGLNPATRTPSVSANVVTGDAGFDARARDRERQIEDLRAAQTMSIPVAPAQDVLALRHDLDSKNRIIDELQREVSEGAVAELKAQVEHHRSLVRDLQTALRAQEESFQEMLRANEKVRVLEDLKSNLEKSVAAFTEERTKFMDERAAKDDEIAKLQQQLKDRDAEHAAEMSEVRDAFADYDHRVTEYVENLRNEHAIEKGDLQEALSVAQMAVTEQQQLVQQAQAAAQAERSAIVEKRGRGGASDAAHDQTALRSALVDKLNAYVNNKYGLPKNDPSPRAIQDRGRRLDEALHLQQQQQQQDAAPHDALFNDARTPLPSGLFGGSTAVTPVRDRGAGGGVGGGAVAAGPFGGAPTPGKMRDRSIL